MPELPPVTQRFDGDASGLRGTLAEIKALYGEAEAAQNAANQRMAQSAALGAGGWKVTRDQVELLKSSLQQTATAAQASGQAQARAAAAAAAAEKARFDKLATGIKIPVEIDPASKAKAEAEFTAFQRSMEAQSKATTTRPATATAQAGGPQLAQQLLAEGQRAQQAAAATRLYREQLSSTTAAARAAGTATNFTSNALDAVGGSSRLAAREFALWVEHLSAGTFTTRTFLYETSFLASAITPLAAYFVAAGAAVYFLGKAFFETADTSKETRDRIDQLAKSLEVLGGKSADVHRITDAVADLQGVAATQAKVEVKLDVASVAKQVAEAQKEIAKLSQSIKIGSGGASPITPPILDRGPARPAPSAEVSAQSAQAATLAAAARSLEAISASAHDSKTSLDSAAQSADDFARNIITQFPDLALKAIGLATEFRKMSDEIAINPERAQALHDQAGALADQIIIGLKGRQGDVQTALGQLLKVGGKEVDPEFFRRYEAARAAFAKTGDSTTATALLKSLSDLKEQGGKNIDDFTLKIDGLIRKLQEFQQKQADIATAQFVLARPEFFDQAARERNAQELERRGGQGRPETRAAGPQFATVGVEGTTVPQAPPAIRAVISGAAAASEDTVKRTRFLEQEGRSESAIAAILTQEKETNTQLNLLERNRLSTAQAQVDALARQQAELKKQQEAREALPTKVREQAVQNAIAAQPTQQLRDAAAEAAELGASLADLRTPDSLMRFLQTLAPSLREGTAELVALKQEARTLQLGTQAQNQRNQNIAALVPPGPTRIGAQALVQQGIDLAPKGTPPILKEAEALKIVHAQMDALGDSTRRVTEEYIAQAEAAAQIQLKSDLDKQLEQAQLSLRYAGQESEEYRVQAQLLQIKAQQGDVGVKNSEAEVRQIQAANAELRRQNDLRQIGARTTETRAQVQAAGNVPDILSQQALGIPSEDTRVRAEIRSRREAGQSVDRGVIAAVRSQEEMNTQLAITKELLPGIADQMAQIAQTAMFEGPEAAAQQFIQTLSQMAIKIGILIALQATFNALSAGGGAGGGATVTSRTSTPLTGAALGAGLGGAQTGGPLRAGQRAHVAEDRQAELWVGDSAARRMTRGGMDASTMAAATGLPEAQVRRMAATPGGKALLGMVAESGGSTRSPAASGGMKVLGAKGQPEVFVAPESGTVIPNPDLRALQSTPAGRQVLRRIGFAAGGRVERGQRVLTGEEGEEQWVPDRLLTQAFGTQAPSEHAYANRLFASDARPESFGRAMVASASDAHAVAAIARRGDSKDVPGFPYRGEAVAQHSVGRIVVGERGRRDDARNRLDLIGETGHLFVPDRYVHVDPEAASARFGDQHVRGPGRILVPPHVALERLIHGKTERVEDAEEPTVRQQFERHAVGLDRHLPLLPLDRSVRRLVEPLELVNGDRVRPPAMVEREIAVRARQDAFFGHDLERPRDASGARERLFAPARHFLSQPAVMPGKPQDDVGRPVDVRDQQLARHAPLLPDRLLVPEILPSARSNIVVGHSVQVGLQALKGGVVATQRAEEGFLHASGVDPAVGHMHPQRRTVELGLHEALPGPLDLLVGHRPPHVSKLLVPGDDAAPGGFLIGRAGDPGHRLLLPGVIAAHDVGDRRDSELGIQMAARGGKGFAQGGSVDPSIRELYPERHPVYLRHHESAPQAPDLFVGHRSAFPFDRSKPLVLSDRQLDVEPALPRFFDEILGFDREARIDAQLGKRLAVAMRDDERLSRTAEVNVWPRKEGFYGRALKFGPHEAAPHDIKFVVGHRSAPLPVQDLGLDRQVGVNLGDDGIEHRAEGRELGFKPRDLGPRAFQLRDRGVPVRASRAAAQLFGDLGVDEKVVHRSAPFVEFGISESVAHRSVPPQAREQILPHVPAHIGDLGFQLRDLFPRVLERADRAFQTDSDWSQAGTRGVRPHHQIEPLGQLGVSGSGVHRSAPFVVTEWHGTDAVDDIADHFAKTRSERFDSVERVHDQHLSRVVRDITRLAVDQRQILEQPNAIRDLVLPPVRVTNKGPSRVFGRHLRSSIRAQVGDLGIGQDVVELSSRLVTRGVSDGGAHPIQLLAGRSLVGFDGFEPRPGPAQRFDHLGRPPALGEVVHSQIHAVQPGKPSVQFGVAGAVVDHGLGLLPGGHVDVEQAPRLAGLRLPQQLSVQRFSRLGQIEPAVEADRRRLPSDPSTQPSVFIGPSGQSLEQHLVSDAHRSVHFMPRALERGLMERPVELGVQQFGRFDQVNPAVADVDPGHVSVVGNVPVARHRSEAFVHDAHERLGRDHGLSPVAALGDVRGDARFYNVGAAVPQLSADVVSGFGDPVQPRGRRGLVGLDEFEARPRPAEHVGHFQGEPITSVVGKIAQPRVDLSVARALQFGLSHEARRAEAKPEHADPAQLHAAIASDGRRNRAMVASARPLIPGLPTIGTPRERVVAQPDSAHRLSSLFGTYVDVVDVPRFHADRLRSPAQLLVQELRHLDHIEPAIESQVARRPLDARDAPRVLRQAKRLDEHRGREHGLGLPSGYPFAPTREVLAPAAPMVQVASLPTPKFAQHLDARHGLVLHSAVRLPVAGFAPREMDAPTAPAVPPKAADAPYLNTRPGWFVGRLQADAPFSDLGRQRDFGLDHGAASLLAGPPLVKGPTTESPSFLPAHARFVDGLGTISAAISNANSLTATLQAPSAIAAVAGMIAEGVIAGEGAMAAAVAAAVAAGPAVAAAGDGGGDGGGAAVAAMAPGGPLRAGQQAVVGEKGPELLLRGRLADAARAGKLEQAVARLDGMPRQDWPVVLGARGQERIISDRSSEVLKAEDFRRLSDTHAGARMLTLIGASRPSALTLASPSMPGPEHVRHLAAGTVDTTQMLTSGARSGAAGNQQIVVNNAAPEFRVIDQRQTGSPPIEMSSQRGPDGRMVITAMVRAATAEMLRTGEHQSVMRNVYGITPRPRA